jgi:predicted short-subunit dehydrogenase-like oxidoreductase (DUF2520 family)
MPDQLAVAASYASQLINVLLRETSEIWQSWGASEQDAVAALLPLAYGTLASIENAGLVRGMPGSVSRWVWKVAVSLQNRQKSFV